MCKRKIRLIDLTFVVLFGGVPEELVFSVEHVCIIYLRLDLSFIGS